MNIGDTITGALFSGPEQTYRLALWRLWDSSKPALLFVGLNPSTANGTKDDPTIRRLAGYAKAWGYGGLFAGNLFSYVTPDPGELFVKGGVELPGGPNDEALRQMRGLSGLALLGWGHLGANAGKRPEAVIALLGEPVYCLTVTRNGEPGHPLYLRRDLKPRPYEREVKP